MMGENSGAGGPAERGEMWLERGRPDKAEGELRQALAQDPDDALSKARLAHCFLQIERLEESVVLAREAVGAEPEWGYPRLVLAIGLICTDREKEGEQVARDALEIEPDLPNLHGVLAMALGAQKRWKEALAAAEAGLALDPEDETCLGERGSAMTQLGRRSEAAEGLLAALQHNPENPRTHYQLGLNALHAGNGEEAIRYFRETLRLDPGNEEARAGLVEAMKARTGLYRPFLAFFLFLGRLPQRQVYMLLIGSIFLRKFLKAAADANPTLSFVIMPVYVGIVGFILMSWIASPLFDLVLRFSKEGRYALTETEIFRSNCLAAVLLLAGILAIAGLAGIPAMYLAAGLMAAWAIPLTRALHAEGPKGKLFHRLAAIVLLVLGAVSVVDSYRFKTWWESFGTGVHVVELPVDERPQRIAELSWPELERMGAEAEKFKVEFPEYSAKKKRSETLLGAFLVAFILLTWVP